MRGHNSNVLARTVDPELVGKLAELESRIMRHPDPLAAVDGLIRAMKRVETPQLRRPSLPPPAPRAFPRLVQ